MIETLSVIFNLWYLKTSFLRNIIFNLHYHKKEKTEIYRLISNAFPINKILVLSFICTRRRDIRRSMTLKANSRIWDRMCGVGCSRNIVSIGIVCLMYSWWSNPTSNRDICQSTTTQRNPTTRAIISRHYLGADPHQIVTTIMWQLLLYYASSLIINIYISFFCSSSDIRQQLCVKLKKTCLKKVERRYH